MDEVLDVPLVARLRPSPLVVLPRLLFGLVDDLGETPRLQAIDGAPLAGDDRDEVAVPPGLTGERRDVEPSPDPSYVARGL